MKIEVPDLIQKCISAFEKENKVEKMWKTPLCAAIKTNHPLIPELKKSVSQDHLLPEDLLPDAKSIVVFFLPFENYISESNAVGESPSNEWAKAYILTNTLISYINDEIEKTLKKQNINIAKILATSNFNKEKLMSFWSHRHIAWIAGLGTFGINNMFITSMGCCGRFGSFITNVDSSSLGIPSNDSGPQAEKCLTKRNAACSLCLKKCNYGAYTETGFDRHTCYTTCKKNGAHFHNTYGLADAEVCGKCLVGLPCSTKAPA